MTEFNAIAADPPWPERGGGKIKRGADKHYGLMSRSDILATMLRAPCWTPATDCHLFMWSTMSSLEDSLWVMDGLGFRYVTHGVWVKTRPDLMGGLACGIGQYFRGAHELYLLGVRGSGFAVRSDARDIPSVILAPPPREDGKRVHSRKPTQFYDMIDRRTIGPKLEMFARTPRGPDWTIWGDQAPEEIKHDAEPDQDEDRDDAVEDVHRDAAPQESEGA